MSEPTVYVLIEYPIGSNHISAIYATIELSRQAGDRWCDRHSPSAVRRETDHGIEWRDVDGVLVLEVERWSVRTEPA